MYSPYGIYGSKPGLPTATVSEPAAALKLSVKASKSWQQKISCAGPHLLFGFDAHNSHCLGACYKLGNGGGVGDLHLLIGSPSCASRSRSGRQAAPVGEP